MNSTRDTCVCDRWSQSCNINTGVLTTYESNMKFEIKQKSYDEKKDRGVEKFARSKSANIMIIFAGNRQKIHKYHWHAVQLDGEPLTHTHTHNYFWIEFSISFQFESTRNRKVNLTMYHENIETNLIIIFMLLLSLRVSPFHRSTVHTKHFISIQWMWYVMALRFWVVLRHKNLFRFDFRSAFFDLFLNRPFPLYLASCDIMGHANHLSLRSNASILRCNFDIDSAFQSSR